MLFPIRKGWFDCENAKQFLYIILFHRTVNKKSKAVEKTEKAASKLFQL